MKRSKRARERRAKRMLIAIAGIMVMLLLVLLLILYVRQPGEVTDKPNSSAIQTASPVTSTDLMEGSLSDDAVISSTDCDHSQEDESSATFSDAVVPGISVSAEP